MKDLEVKGGKDVVWLEERVEVARPNYFVLLIIGN